jgi:NAD(P)-dependent dehydrogenase (short-subunit alcohol dehydrogenase family)
MDAAEGGGAVETSSQGRLAGRVAVVTGAGRGIGRAIADRYVDEGATVVVCARTSGDIEAVVERAKERGLPGLSLQADVTDIDGARAPVRAAVSEFGRVDILVNNVGGSRGLTRDPFECPDGDFESQITLIVLATWWASREALPHMRANQWGRIINIGSGASKVTSGFVAYTAAKHGVVGMTKELAMKAGRFGITVNCLCPGWTLTSAVNWEAVGRMNGGMSADAARAWAEDQAAEGRILTPEELTGTATLLASDEGGGITGQVISVDGGFKI